VKVALFAAVLLNCESSNEGPDTMDQVSVPVPVLAASVNEGDVMQLLWSGPALDVVGCGVTSTGNSAVVPIAPPLEQVVFAV
jgi:hypothetical protein